MRGSLLGSASKSYSSPFISLLKDKSVAEKSFEHEATSIPFDTPFLAWLIHPRPWFATKGPKQPRNDSPAQSTSSKAAAERFAYSDLNFDESFYSGVFFRRNRSVKQYGTCHPTPTWTNTTDVSGVWPGASVNLVEVVLHYLPSRYQGTLIRWASRESCT